MRGVRAGVTIAAWIFVALFLSACSSWFTFLKLPAVSPPPQPQPVPAPPHPTMLPVEDYSSPDRVYAELVRWFSRAGYRDFQIEALAEHARIESGFRPCATNGPDLRYTFQWSGARLRRLDQFAGSRGGCPPLEKQLAFADDELRNVPSYACFWRATTKSAALAALRRGFGGGSC
jgi:hypothetical protein